MVSHWFTIIPVKENSEVIKIHHAGKCFIILKIVLNLPTKKVVFGCSYISFLVYRRVNFHYTLLHVYIKPPHGNPIVYNTAHAYTHVPYVHINMHLYHTYDTIPFYSIPLDSIHIPSGNLT